MNVLPKNNIIIVNHEIIDAVRKEFDLHKPEFMREAVDIIETWIQKQDHLLKKDFPKVYLENTITGCKGSIERAKTMIDKYCTMRTLHPQYFEIQDIKETFKELHKICYVVPMPRVTDDHCHLLIFKFNNIPKVGNYVKLIFQYGLILADYLINHEITTKYTIIHDLSDISMSQLMSNLNIMEINQFITIGMECYGGRLNRIQVITSSALVDTLVSLLKKCFKPKISERFVSHQTYEGLWDYYPLEILPKDFGGKERSIPELHDLWFNELTSQENIEYLNELRKAKTDESLRPTVDFSEKYAGMAGTFRFLHLD